MMLYYDLFWIFPFRFASFVLFLCLSSNVCFILVSSVQNFSKKYFCLFVVLSVC